MRISKLLLQAYGPFTGRELDFGALNKSLVLISGPNEAGKSATLRAISDLRFGIPHLSTDNFVHANSDMRIGGVFVDRDGRPYPVVRRKGRSSTLTYIDGDKDAPGDRVVSAEVEALITSSLSRDEYEKMYGLDHQRLRDGGEALRKGEGEIGAALFEASAGVRSISELLERMDQHARKFFMPGPRGKNASINVGLKIYEEAQASLRKSLVKPAHWTDLYRRHQSALEQLDQLDRRKLALNSHLLLIKELTAVAPLLGTLDQAARVLEELKDARILGENASLERTVASTALAAATEGAATAAAEVARRKLEVDGIRPDARILSIATAIERLAASADLLDSARKDHADAALEADEEQRNLSALAERICASLTAEEIIRKIPAGADRAEIDSKLRQFERSELALNQHRKAQPRDANVDDSGVARALPTQEARMALRAAHTEVSRNEATLKRLADLPGEVNALTRTLSTMLSDLGLKGTPELHLARPLRDAEVSSAVSARENNATRQGELRKRMTAIGVAIEKFNADRLTLLAEGEVPTRDDVYAARKHRELGWSLVREKYIESKDPAVDQFVAEGSLVDAYENAVKRADELVDGFAGDTERAAQLQACMRNIANLEDDLAKLRRQLDSLQEEDRQLEARWYVSLDAAGLPRRHPAALAEWQQLLKEARSVSENLQTKSDELERAARVEATLAKTLLNAIAGTTIASPTADASLSALVAICVEVESEIKQREKAIDTTKGERAERDRQQQLWIARDKELEQELLESKGRLIPILQRLFIADTTESAVIRARLDELDILLGVSRRLDAARGRQKRASELANSLERQAEAAAKACGEADVVDARLLVDRMTSRLVEAKALERRLELANQSLENANSRHQEQLEMATKQTRVLTSLCVASGVDDPGRLPEVEELSRRKREAQSEWDRSHIYIGKVSRRTIAELKDLLNKHDAARLRSEEERCSTELEELQGVQSQARAREVEARRALEAVDSSDIAAGQREAMEVAAASVRANLGPWMRSKLAHALLAEALRRFRERAQGPMLKSASSYFERMTGGEFRRLLSEGAEESVVLVAERQSGARLTVEMLSEGTRDQLYLALRLAALEVRRTAGINLPLILDDVLATSDDHRASLMLKTLADFSRESQVIVLTHHHHVVALAQRSVPNEMLMVVNL